MKLMCNKCGKEFEHRKKRKACFECTPRKNRYDSEEEKKTARRKQLVTNTKRRRDKVKDMSIEYKGGKCQVCGYDKCKGAL